MNDTLVISKNPAEFAAALKSILYKVGGPTGLEYGKFAVVLPAQTVGLVPKLTDGNGFIVATTGVLKLGQAAAGVQET